jgi:RNA polymerase sigma-70 factor (ECF subfamily)
MTTTRRPNKAAWIEEALERYEGSLIRYAAHITGNLESAREVAQDTFLRLCEADRAAVEGRLAPWLYTVCRNRALDVRKKEGRTMPLTDELAAVSSGSHAGPRDTAAYDETQRLVLDALHKLPEDQQEAFRLKFQDGLTYREIGGITGKSLGTVSNLITQAMAAMRAELRVTLGVAEEG